MVKNLLVIQETRVQSLGQKDPLEKEMAAHSVFLPGESHGQRSLVGHSPEGPRESDSNVRGRTKQDIQLHVPFLACEKAKPKTALYKREIQGKVFKILITDCFDNFFCLLLCSPVFL